MASKNKIIGIDLGTTNSVVAVMEGQQPVVIANAEGARTTPSIVGFTDDGVLVGGPAKRQLVTNPENTVYSIKRFMGRRRSEVAVEEKRVPYKITGRPDDWAKVEIRGKEYAPPEISARVLGYLKKAAEDYLGHPVTEAVITVPAYFNDSQRQATKDAGKVAGLEVKRIINEPTAASLAYGLDKKKDEHIAVYDLGGGTFDISILDVGEGAFEVLSTNGDTHLGGDDFDAEIVSYCCDEFKRETGMDLRQLSDRRQRLEALQRLREAAEKAKVELSSVMQTELSLPYITADAGGPKHLNVRLTRAKLETLVAGLVERTVAPVRQALKDAGLATSEIDQVVLVGGMTRMPAVQAKVKELFGREPHKGVNPDEVVAVGAAIQGGVLNKEVSDIVLLDVTPLTLGVETKGGLMSPIIPRNTTIPVTRSQSYTTAEDNQRGVTVKVYQGERKLTADCRLLGQFDLEGIPSAPQGYPKIEVTFTIDANGILSVSAKDKATNKEQSIRAINASGLNEGEIQRMVGEAEQHAAEDEQKKELIDLHNQADFAVHTAEKELQEHGAKVDADTKATVEAAVGKLKEAAAGDDAAAIRRRLEELTQALQKIGEAVYKDVRAAEEAQAKAQEAEVEQPSAREAAAGAGGGGPEGEKTVDADFEVVDGDKKKK